MARMRVAVLSRASVGISRRSVNALIERHLLLWDVCMACLALLFLAVGFLQDDPADAANASILALAEYILTVVFFVEFVLRLYVAPSRRAYLRAHWIDLLALLPAIRWLRFLRITRFARILEFARLLRLGVLVRVLVELDRVIREMRNIVARNGVHVFFLIATSLVMAGGTLVWTLEHDTNPSFRNFGDAIWWAFATVTTIGYGDGPTTLAGRIVAAVIMILGVSCFGVISGTTVAYFMQRAPNDPSKQQDMPDELMRVLEDIRSRLDRIEQDIHTGEAPTVADRSVLARALDGHSSEDRHLSERAS